jgi:prepilin-type N-terminal cleavage/methylation domain-containing protein
MRSAKGFTLINFLRKTTNVNRGFNFRRKIVPEQSEGFTLIELLVVVVIIVIIGSIAVFTFSQSLVKSRDARRKSDVQAIVSALEVYYQKNNQYPIATTAFLSNVNSPWITGLTSTYIDNVPKDPKQDQGDPLVGGFQSDGSGSGKSGSFMNFTGYSYWTPNTGGVCPNVGQYYVLAAGLENVNDPDADAQKNYQYCGGDLTTRTNVYAVTSQ